MPPLCATSIVTFTGIVILITVMERAHIVVGTNTIATVAMRKEICK